MGLGSFGHFSELLVQKYNFKRREAEWYCPESDRYNSLAGLPVLDRV